MLRRWEGAGFSKTELFSKVTELRRFSQNYYQTDVFQYGKHF
jgi:hypothetical protein